MTAPLWPHQSRLIEEARARYSAGFRRILCVLPTGGGKTYCAATMAAPIPGRVLWIAHLEELLSQARATLTTLGATNTKAESIQALYRRVRRGWTPPAYAGVIVDEAHHACARSYRAVIDALSPPLLFGLTATPSRLDGRALGSVFDSLAIGATTSQLIRSQVLVPTIVIGPTDPTPKPTLAANPVDAYVERAPGSKALVFCNSVRHAAELASEFTTAGYPAASLDGRVHRRDRADINEQFRAGTLRVLTNARLLSEGYDVPNVDTVILASNMTSPAMLLQATGRGKRAAPGKAAELLLDLVGVCARLGIHPDDDINYSLSGKPITGPTEGGLILTQCAECGRVFRAHDFRDSTCPYCHHVRPGRPDPVLQRQRLEEQRAEQLRVNAARQPADRVAYLAHLFASGSRNQARFLFNQAYGYWPSNVLCDRAAATGGTGATGVTDEAMS